MLATKNVDDATGVDKSGRFKSSKQGICTRTCKGGGFAARKQQEEKRDEEKQEVGQRILGKEKRRKRR